ncbi:hypothetical protein LTR53_007168 [Teratosphaeriaceae sp. CCFEE 6253]|nr:hypothetical protein LTR53_007168 [Teratosphaeriaceae sp. CCFEE 6253]
MEPTAAPPPPTTLESLLPVRPIHPQLASPLLNLPPELRNEIYAKLSLAPTPKLLLALAPGPETGTSHHHPRPLPHPFSFTCRQIHTEFTPLHHRLILAHADEVEIRTIDFALPLPGFAHALQNLAGLGPGVGVGFVGERTVRFAVTLTPAFHLANLDAFVARFAEPAVPPKLTSRMSYSIRFASSPPAPQPPQATSGTTSTNPAAEPATDPAMEKRQDELPDLPAHRLLFARQAKRYRFHHCDGAQRCFERIYWAFAAAAERVDGVGMREYAMGCWRTGEGRWWFV